MCWRTKYEPCHIQCERIIQHYFLLHTSNIAFRHFIAYFKLFAVPATIEALPEIVEAVGNQLTVMIDGGIRNGMYKVFSPIKRQNIEDIFSSHA